MLPDVNIANGSLENDDFYHSMQGFSKQIGPPETDLNTDPFIRYHNYKMSNPTNDKSSYNDFHIACREEYDRLNDREEHERWIDSLNNDKDKNQIDHENQVKITGRLEEKYCEEINVLIKAIEDKIKHNSSF